jgi:hypothetical protein
MEQHVGRMVSSISIDQASSIGFYGGCRGERRVRSYGEPWFYW